MLMPSVSNDENGDHYGQIPPIAMEESVFPNFDLYGAIIRRKYLVFLIACVSAIVAYFVYCKATPVYATTLRLMVWTQSPPTIVNGEVIPTTVAISKQQNLIASNLLLSDAIKNQEFEKLRTFQGVVNPVGALKRMLKIVPVEKSTDTLDLTLTGGDPKELPDILSGIVATYIKFIGEDTISAGKESVSLIQQLQTKMESDQRLDQRKYFDLLKKLSLTSENEAGKWVNPYTANIQRLRLEKDACTKKIDELVQKMKALEEALGETTDAKSKRKLLAIEARNELQMRAQDSTNILDLLSVEERTNLNRLQNRLEILDGKIFEMEAQKDDLLRQFGPNHQTVNSISSILQPYVNRKRQTELELNNLTSVLDAKQIDLAKSRASASEFNESDNELFLLYKMKLRKDWVLEKQQLTNKVQELSVAEEGAKAIAGDMAEVNMLKAQIDERRDAVGKILDKLTAINVLSNNYSTTKVRVIDPAIGAWQVAPILSIYMAIGVFLGALTGVGLAVLIDHSDLSFRTPIDIQHSLATNVICKIPKIRKSKSSIGFGGVASSVLVSAHDPLSPASEAFRAARTALLFSSSQTGGKVFLITSPSPGDGKSTTSSNVAVSLAQSKKSVVLVDADFRRPKVHQIFGVPIEPGCVEYLNGNLDLDEMVRPSKYIENLSIITSGGRPKDAGELIASSKFAELVAALRARFDFVIIDSPPILPVADSTSLCSVADGIFLVLRIRKGVMLAAHKAKQRIDMVRGNVLGVIVNGMDENAHYNEYGMYYRGSYYTGNSRYYEAQNASYAEKR